MVERLEEIRLRVMSELPFAFGGYIYERTKLNPDYAEAFKDYGIDVADLDAPTAAERIRASAIRAQLAGALDEWLWAKFCRIRDLKVTTRPDVTQRDVELKEENARYEHLRAVADLAVPNEWCQRVRDPAVHQDRPALEELAGRREVADLPPSAAMLLAR